MANEKLDKVVGEIEIEPIYYGRSDDELDKGYWDAIEEK